MSDMLPVAGFDGYHITSDGRVWSTLRHGGSSGRWLKPRPSGRGYLAVQLFRDRTGINVYVHALVAEAFIGPRPEGLEVRHLNGDMLDNRVENLAYGTHSENMQDSVRHGTARGWKASVTHCPQGHAYDGENLYVNPQGARECRECGRSRAREYWRRKHPEASRRL